MPGIAGFLIGRLEWGLTYKELADTIGKPRAEAARKAAQRALVRLIEEMGPPIVPEPRVRLASRPSFEQVMAEVDNYGILALVCHSVLNRYRQLNSDVVAQTAQRRGTATLVEQAAIALAWLLLAARYVNPTFRWELALPLTELTCGEHWMTLRG